MIQRDSFLPSSVSIAPVEEDNNSMGAKAACSATPRHFILPFGNDVSPVIDLYDLLLDNHVLSKIPALRGLPILNCSISCKSFRQ